MNKGDLNKEYRVLKRKFSIPSGKDLKEMLSTEDGKRRYEKRIKKWQAFKDKWDILFFIKDKPVFRKGKK